MATFESNVSNTYKLILEITQGTQSINDNNTVLNWVLKMNNNGMKYQNSSSTDAFYVAINGTEVLNAAKAIWFSSNYSTIEIASGSLTVPHDADGSKSVYAYFSFAPGRTAYYYPGAMSGEGNMSLTSIPRQATLTDAPNFTDEDNPTIYYKNPAGEAVSSLKACISLTGAKDDIVYRDISKTGSSYTFELTAAERQALINATPNSNSRAVKFYVATTIGGFTYHSMLDKTLTIANTTPEITVSAKDVGAASLLLTGDKNKIIKGFNYVLASMSSTLKKGATIKSQSIVCGDQTLIGETGGSASMEGGLNNLESNTIAFGLTDSRNNTVNKYITLEMIDYVKLTCNLKANNPTADGKMSLKINGNYFNGNFGATNNTLAVEFRYKENNGDYDDWIAASATKSGNTYEATVNLTGLNYQSAYTFQARAIDKVNTIESAEKKVKSIPVFDWGEKDFNINGDLTIKGTNLIDLIYPIGSIYMSVNYFDPATIFGGKWERLMDRFLLGSGAIYASGQEGGEAEHQLEANEMALDSTPVFDSGITEELWCAGEVKSYGAGTYKLTYSPQGFKRGPHNNMPPYLTVNMWKRVE